MYHPEKCYHDTALMAWYGTFLGGETYNQRLQDNTALQSPYHTKKSNLSRTCAAALWSRATRRSVHLELPPDRASAIGSAPSRLLAPY